MTGTCTGANQATGEGVQCKRRSSWEFACPRNDCGQPHEWLPGEISKTVLRSDRIRVATIEGTVVAEVVDTRGRPVSISTAAAPAATLVGITSD